MTSQIDSIVSVSISTQTVSPSRVGFGVPLVLGFHTKWTDRVRYYTSLAGMLTDGFVTTDAIYLAAKSVFAQNPAPQKIAVGRLTTANVMTLDLTPIVTNNHVYTLVVNGVTYTYTSDGTATAAEIVGGFVTALAADATITATNVANVLHIVAVTAGTLFTVAQNATEFTRVDNTPDTCGIAAQIAATQVVDDTWYALILVDQGKALITAAAAFIETQTKIMIACNGDSGMLDSASTTDAAFVLKAANYKRSAVMFKRDPHSYPAAAWDGNVLPTNPGSATWKFKTLAGVAADTFTTTEIANLEAKNCNYYTSIAGVSITEQGKLASGEFIDVTIFVDWLKAQIQTGIYTVLVQNKKVPFTDAGIQLLGGQIKAALDLGASSQYGGIIDGTQQVILPKASAVAPADRTARQLQPVTFQGQLAGAVHSMILSGTLTT